MDTLLAEAVARVPLENGSIYRERVGDREVQVRLVETSNLDDGGMIEMWLDMPPSPKAYTVELPIGPKWYPPPFVIDESDLAPERFTRFPL